MLRASGGQRYDIDVATAVAGYHVQWLVLIWSIEHVWPASHHIVPYVHPIEQCSSAAVDWVDGPHITPLCDSRLSLLRPMHSTATSTTVHVHGLIHLPLLHAHQTPTPPHPPNQPSTAHSTSPLILTLVPIVSHYHSTHADNTTLPDSSHVTTRLLPSLTAPHFSLHCSTFHRAATINSTTLSSVPTCNTTD